MQVSQAKPGPQIDYQGLLFGPLQQERVCHRPGWLMFRL